ncbi:hypothetical protein NA57DRAFT_50737 [Rhizodiscina lignyota]|uniref:Uncharacterized protein n=1 Tax=Rhizodiscina lignyota TaxID=1504668 RepID=A0A9P4IMJ0_9PEZI|nr:hypothetical protein NA57DRAFT_50737 [Rhizodiscina lignyota]
MSPNPYILLRNLVTPSRWFAQSTPNLQKAKGRIEHWDKPLPGYYEYIPGRGWFLIAIDSDNGEKLDNPVPLTYCRILHRFMLKDDFEGRKRWGIVKDEQGVEKRGVLFRMDDGVTWIYCWNEFGVFDVSERRIPYCVDSDTKKFRIMSASDRQGLNDQSSGSTTRQASSTETGTSVTPSMMSFVDGDVHRPPRVRTPMPTSTQPSTRPSTRPSSSHGSGLQPALTQSTATTPPSFVEPQTPPPKFDAPELDQKLKRLAEG